MWMLGMKLRSSGSVTSVFIPGVILWYMCTRFVHTDEPVCMHVCVRGKEYNVGLFLQSIYLRQTSSERVSYWLD